jgi:hypothetical protein
MGFNKKVLSKAVSELGKAKAPAKPRDIITDPAGQWKFPGQETRIPGSSITMQGVNYPVWAQPNVGPGSMMQPNKDYEFPNADYVDETPMVRKGGSLKSKKYSKSISATNKLFTKNKLFKNKKNKIFDPNAEFKSGGSKLGPINLNPNPLSHYELNYGFNLPTKQDGGVSPIEGDLISKVIMNRNRDKGFVNRAYALGANPGTSMFNVFEPDQFGQTMSHKMGWGTDDNGQAWMFPTVLNPNDEAIPVPNQYADYISSQGYKNATGMNEYEEGGENDDEYMDLTDEEIQAYRDAGYEVDELPEIQEGGPTDTIIYPPGDSQYMNQPALNYDILEMQNQKARRNYEQYLKDSTDPTNLQRTSPAFQQKHFMNKDVVNAKTGGYVQHELVKAQGGKTVYSGPNRGLVGPSTPKNNGSPLLPKQDLIKKYQQEVDKAKAAKIAEAERIRQKAIAKQKAINDAIPRGPVSDNTRTVIPNQVVSDINNTAIINSPEYKAEQKAKKEAQAAFEKEQWNKYNKMSFSEKALDRTQAAIAHPILMAGNALTGNQAYIPGMGRGLMNTESPDYDKYLKATGQTKGQFEISDLANIINPGYWGGHAGNELNKGNYTTGLLEAGLAFTGVPGVSKNAIQGAKYLGKDIAQGAKHLGKTLGTETGLLSKAYKINPTAFKPNPTSAYRMLGKEGLEDAKKSGVFRSNQVDIYDPSFSNKAFEETYYSQGVPFDARKYKFPQEVIDKTSFAGEKNNRVWNWNKFEGPHMVEVVNSHNMPNFNKYGASPMENFGYEITTPGNKPVLFNDPNVNIYKQHWLQGYKKIPTPSTTNAPIRSGLGNMNMSKYEIKNPDYYTQLLGTYDSKALSPTNKKFYKDLIGSVKNQNGLVTERQFNELQRLKSGNFNFGKKAYEQGGITEAWEDELDDHTIALLKKAGYTVEELD